MQHEHKNSDEASYITSKNGDQHKQDRGEHKPDQDSKGIHRHRGHHGGNAETRMQNKYG